VTHIHRRTFLKSTLAGAALTVAAAAGLLKPNRVLAAEWPKGAFEAEKIAAALQSLYGSSESSPSGSIKIKAQLQAETGDQVPIAVTAELPNIEALSIYVEKNPRPLVANVSFSGAEGYFNTRMKMGQTSDVHVICKAGGKLYTAKQTIKVTVGGCGG
jgi:sulfur-oxidizing protein SoxY